MVCVCVGPPGVTARFAPYYTDFTCLANAFVLTVPVTEHVGLPLIVLTLLAFLFSSSSFRVAPRHAVTRAFFSVCRFLRGSYLLGPCGSISAAAAVSSCLGSDPTSFAASCAGLFCTCSRCRLLRALTGILFLQLPFA